MFYYYVLSDHKWQNLKHFVKRIEAVVLAVYKDTIEQ